SGAPFPPGWMPLPAVPSACLQPSTPASACLLDSSSAVATSSAWIHRGGQYQMEGRGARARRAFGGPGIEPRWTRSAKDGVGTAYATSSRLWYTLSLGIITEAYFPTIDRPQLRDRKSTRLNSS